MQIPRRPTGQPALATRIFRDTDATSAFSAVREKWKFRIAKGALILICTSATAGRITPSPCITHGSRMEIDCITEKDRRKAKRRKGKAPRQTLSSCLFRTASRSSTLHDSLSESETFNPLHSPVTLRCCCAEY